MKYREKIPPTGIEPVRPEGHQILSLGRLPIPPRWPFQNLKRKVRKTGCCFSESADYCRDLISSTTALKYFLSSSLAFDNTLLMVDIDFTVPIFLRMVIADL